MVPDQRLCVSIGNGLNQKVSAKNKLCVRERIAGNMPVRQTKDRREQVKCGLGGKEGNNKTKSFVLGLVDRGTSEG